MISNPETAMSEAPRDGLVARLWPDGDGPECMQVYAAVDAACDPRIHALVSTTGLEHCCLFSGRLHAELQAAAPYLIHLSPTAPFTGQFLTIGQLNNWGIIILAAPSVTLQQLHRHLRGLLRVRDEIGRALLFRFYDPRVAAEYFPTCTPEEVETFFGPIQTIYTAGTGTLSLTHFSHKNGHLIQASVQRGTK